jgi:pimeloyl-ACP methyl ester carboxylesterase
VLDLAAPRQNAPPLVLLHEGLGSVGLWRTFPAALQRATGARVVAYSRLGHGRSEPPPEPRGLDFMHREAREVLPDLLRALRIERPLLVGHSDGASIALIYAAEHEVAGVVAIAPHVFVESVCVEAIAAVHDDYTTRLRDRMGRHHRDPDVTFRGWADVWLDPNFGDWDITALLPGIAAPVLLVQGEDDQYGTLAQLDAIEAAVTAPVERLVVPGGHSPHLDHPDLVVAEISRLVRSLSR